MASPYANVPVATPSCGAPVLEQKLLCDVARPSTQRYIWATTWGWRDPQPWSAACLWVQFQFSLFMHPDQAQNTSSGIQGQEATAVAVIYVTAPNEKDTLPQTMRLPLGESGVWGSRIPPAVKARCRRVGTTRIRASKHGSFWKVPATSL